MSWLLRIPEGLSCDEGIFKTHEWPLIDWSEPDSCGAVRSAWQSSDADFERIRRYDRAEEFGLRFVQGIRYKVEIRPVEDGADLRLTAANTTAGPTWHNGLANPCLGIPNSTAFEDPGFDRTYVSTGTGLTPLSVADRGSGDPIRTHFDVAGRRGERRVAADLQDPGCIRHFFCTSSAPNRNFILRIYWDGEESPLML